MAWRGVGREGMELKEVFTSGRQQQEEEGVKGYKYPTPKNMTVRPLVTTCPEDTMWRRNFQGQAEWRRKMSSEVLPGLFLRPRRES
jgi:hypothetical protein